MADFVREKRFWFYTKIAEKQDGPPKEFVNGERFPYLGQTYTLKLVDDQDAPLKLLHGRFCLRRELTDDGRAVFTEWYALHADSWLRPRVAEWAARMGLTVSGVEVQALVVRWGSCSSSGTLNFHWATICCRRRLSTPSSRTSWLTCLSRSTRFGFGRSCKQRSSTTRSGRIVWRYMGTPSCLEVTRPVGLI